MFRPSCRENQNTYYTYIQ